MENDEALSLEAIWQAVISGHLKWAAEIEVRLGVDIPVSYAISCRRFAYGRITGDLAEQARNEMWQCEDHLEDLHASVSLLRGDPIKKHRQYREAADLYGRTPWEAIVESGMQCIEVVLIGPDNRVAEMLATEPRLLAAARDRVLHGHDLDSFTPHVRDLIARADSIIALKAFDEVMNGRL